MGNLEPHYKSVIPMNKTTTVVVVTNTEKKVKNNQQKKNQQHSNILSCSFNLFLHIFTPFFLIDLISYALKLTNWNNIVNSSDVVSWRSCCYVSKQGYVYNIFILVNTKN